MVPERARRTDPEESHAADPSRGGELSERQQAVREVLDLGQMRFGHPLTDEELVALYTGVAAVRRLPQQGESGIRTRRHELVELGKVERAGTGVTDMGRPCATWRVRHPPRPGSAEPLFDAAELAPEPRGYHDPEED